MQTFLPYDDFDTCARCLDYRRLGKQRVEAKQILQCLASPNRWQHHPVVRMWKGYEEALKEYYNAIVEEWVARGYNNSMPLFELADVTPMPPWLGDSRVHASHRANLLRKLPEHYGQFGWTEQPYDGYYFPLEPRSEKAKANNKYWTAIIPAQY